MEGICCLYLNLLEKGNSIAMPKRQKLKRQKPKTTRIMKRYYNNTIFNLSNCVKKFSIFRFYYEFGKSFQHLWHIAIGVEKSFYNNFVSHFSRF